MHFVREGCMRRSIPLLLVSTLYFVSPALAADFTGQSVGVSDGTPS